MIVPRTYFNRNWLFFQTNILLAGIFGGLMISGFHYAIYGVSLRDLWGILIFSILHAFAMAYAIAFYTEFLNKNIRFKWIKVPTLLLTGIAGTIMATEVAFYLDAQLFHHTYQWLSHGNQIMLNFSICIIASSVVLLYESQRITYANHYQKKEIDILRLKQLKMKEELEALQSKINPHFLYNSLNTIASLVYDQASLAEELTLKLSKLFRYSINYGQQNFSTLNDELEMIKVFLEIEKIRLGDRLEFSMEVIPPDLAETYIPRFLLQPLVENALKHGLSSRTRQGEISIKISRISKNLHIQLFDNGQAFPQHVVSGQGFQNTYEKLELLYPKQYEFKLLSKPSKHIHLLLPLKLNLFENDMPEKLPSIRE